MLAFAKVYTHTHTHTQIPPKLESEWCKDQAVLPNYTDCFVSCKQGNQLSQLSLPITGHTFLISLPLPCLHLKHNSN